MPIGASISSALELDPDHFVENERKCGACRVLIGPEADTERIALDLSLALGRRQRTFAEADELQGFGDAASHAADG
jgi:hypothetical protein